MPNHPEEIATQAHELQAAEREAAGALIEFYHAKVGGSADPGAGDVEHLLELAERAEEAAQALRRLARAAAGLGRSLSSSVDRSGTLRAA